MKTEFRMQEKLGWGRLATFLPNKGLPVHNWFYYKEGFSRDLVMEILRMFSPERKDWVLDPFCGAGTTMLTCQESGVNSVGFDAHPVSVFASRVKTRAYSIERIEGELSRILEERYTRPRMHVPTGVSAMQSMIRRAFPPRLLEQVAFFRSEILRTPDHEIKDLLMLALMNVSIKSSYLWKDGAVLKIRKKPVPPIKDMLRRQVKRMLRDLEGFGREDCETVAEFGDARSLRLEDGSVSAVITSPPYLNKIEYTRIYGIEQELFLRHVMQAPPVRTFIGLTMEKLEKSSAMLAETLDQETVNSLPQESCPYFTDMTQAIGEMYRVCRPGARIGLVVGNGCFPDRVVDSDVILCRLARSAGFRVERIIVLNKRWCTRNRTEKVGQLRESLLLWRKPD
jgi:DNA modification methylase